VAFSQQTESRTTTVIPKAPAKKNRVHAGTHLQGVVLNSASRREAKSGQSTNRKGEMSRASHNKLKIVKEI